MPGVRSFIPAHSSVARVNAFGGSDFNFSSASSSAPSATGPCRVDGVSVYANTNPSPLACGSGEPSTRVTSHREYPVTVRVNGGWMNESSPAAVASSASFAARLDALFTISGSIAARIAHVIASRTRGAYDVTAGFVSSTVSYPSQPFVAMQWYTAHALPPTS